MLLQNDITLEEVPGEQVQEREEETTRVNFKSGSPSSFNFSKYQTVAKYRNASVRSSKTPYVP